MWEGGAWTVTVTGGHVREGLRGLPRPAGGHRDPCKTLAAAPLRSARSSGEKSPPFMKPFLKRKERLTRRGVWVGRSIESLPGCPRCPRGLWRRDNGVVASELQEVFFFVGVFFVFVCLFLFLFCLLSYLCPLDLPAWTCFRMETKGRKPLWSLSRGPRSPNRRDFRSFPGGTRAAPPRTSCCPCIPNWR